ncbi:antiviral reverse transcriptase Drt3a [Paraburkholderia fungorum]|uniref:Reverse transcriptase domain-containing protein n=1 Tax=Paraburkholderia fungorum TaxID=134537 RepID=A0AAW3UR46_9BURK|nr:antiviral reverse transcriptase Drt3a [Paraburkholderia fungorum]MBB6200813.1 hypothetical protein [Paraburkholderia fungorum]
MTHSLSRNIKRTASAVIEIPYTLSRIERCINYKHIITHKSLLDRENRTRTAKKALRMLNSGSIFSAPLREVFVLGKAAYTFQGVEQEIVSRLISKNIKVNYKIAQQNRHVIIKNLIAMLKESCPFNIYRLDIEKFFESIDRDKLFSKLINEGRCSRLTLLLIYQLFERFDQQGINGLPRGLGISSTFSEYALTNFDAAIRRDRNVFFYARFVDDIVLITSPGLEKGDVVQLIESNISPELKVHKSGKKFASLSVSKAGDTIRSTSPTANFEYLGYTFGVSDHNNPRDLILGFAKRAVKIEICPDKISKLKARTINSFTSFLATQSHPDALGLLSKRLRALTGNYVITDPISKIKIKTGIYFNYSEKNSRKDCPLVALDAMIRGLLFSTRSKLSKRIQSSIHLNDRKKLAGHSFKNGFYSKKIHSFTYEELKNMKKAWKK